jgi:cell division septation protein DedD
MKKKAKAKKALKAKNPTQFSIDLDVKGLVFFLILVFLTASLLFYLGVIFGKASRNPNISGIIPKKIARVSIPGKKPVVTDKLEIFNVRDDSKKISNLKKDTELMLGKVEKMLNEAKAKDAAESKPKVTGKTTTEKKPEKQWPESSQDKIKKGDLYTIQVMATKDKAKADKIVRQLRRKAFDAYLVKTAIQGQDFFRVRVGKKNKEDINKMGKRLDKVIRGMSVKSKLIKIQ